MEKTLSSKKYDLEERTLKFAKGVCSFVNQLTKNISNNEYCKQLIRSSSSIGANYIEANESLSRKDFLLRVKIARKEAKETQYWLNLVDVGSNESMASIQAKMLQEATELTKILSSIIEKST